MIQNRHVGVERQPSSVAVVIASQKGKRHKLHEALVVLEETSTEVLVVTE